MKLRHTLDLSARWISQEYSHLFYVDFYYINHGECELLLTKFPHLGTIFMYTDNIKCSTKIAILCIILQISTTTVCPKQTSVPPRLCVLFPDLQILIIAGWMAFPFHKLSVLTRQNRIKCLWNPH